MVYTLDTAAAADRIVAAGADPALARAIVAEVARADDAHLTHVTTKADIENVRAELSALEVRLVKCGIGIALAVAGLLFAALRLTGGVA